MPVNTATVTAGHTLVSGTPPTLAQINLLGLPVVTLDTANFTGAIFQTDSIGTGPLDMDAIIAAIPNDSAGSLFFYNNYA
jgi:hypothetical protein